MENIRKRQKETNRQMKKLAGLFTGQWGKLMESLVEGDLVALLQARGISVRSTHPRVRAAQWSVMSSHLAGMRGDGGVEVKTS